MPCRYLDLFQRPGINQKLRVDTEGEVRGATLGTGPQTEGFPKFLADFESEKNFDSDFNEVGPIVGFDVQLTLGCNFGIYTNLAASLVYGERDSSYKEEARRFNTAAADVFEDSDDFEYHNSKCRNCTSAMTDGEIGLYYQTCYCFCEKNYDIDVKIGWEHHYFFNQSAIDAARSDDLFRDLNSNLATNGLTLTLGVSY